MKLTNLQYVQSILSSLGSDEVNSVSDTTESLQVLEVLRTTYFNMIGRLHLPEHEQLVQLQPSLDPNVPVVMYIPEGIGKIKWIKYFNSNIINESASGGHDINVDIVSTSPGVTPPPPGYQYVTMVPVQQFIEMTNSFNPLNSNVESFVFTDNQNGTSGPFTFYYKNNKQPQYCAILSNYYVIFDGYDSTQDSTLQANKSMCQGEIVPTWKGTDDFVPNIDDDQVPLLLNEAKSLAYFELKQSSHPKAEQEAKRQWSSVQRDKSIVNRPTYFDALPNFGRGGGYGLSAGWSEFKARGWDRI